MLPYQTPIIPIIAEKDSVMFVTQKGYRANRKALQKHPILTTTTTTNNNNDKNNLIVPHENKDTRNK